MTDARQKGAIESYRSRLGDRGIARFEIQALETDRALIRMPVTKLAEDGPEATQLRRTVQPAISGEPPENRRNLGGAAPFTPGRHRSRSRPSARRGAGYRSVTRNLLDTTIICDLVKPQPREPLLAWLAAWNDDDLLIASLTLAELQRGILDKPAGQRRAALEALFAGPEGPPALFAGRILAFDDKAALLWARLTAGARRSTLQRSARRDHRRRRARTGVLSWRTMSVILRVWRL